MYKLVNDPMTNRLSDYAKKLDDDSFVHRELNAAYLKWLAEGNTPLPADEGNQ